MSYGTVIFFVATQVFEGIYWLLVQNLACLAMNTLSEHVMIT